MALAVYNTESGQKEPFEAQSLPVKMYVCGLTPKNEPHLGHARLFVVNDTIRRYFEYRGFPVLYVQNFTDIDDKIIAAGLREGIPPSEAARRFTESYFRDMDRLNVRRADIFTYVTEYISRIIDMVQALIANGHAYELDGDVYFYVPSFPDYGRLSGRDADAMLAGARIEPDERKRDPRDFALWKAAKPGEPWWESPWGRGRPGWHIECSTMSMAELGPQIDVHGGGTDLIFPHHENEIAQSESASGVVPFVRYWMHTGMLSLPSEEATDEKMAHSGTFVTIRSVLADGSVPAPALRTYLLGQHYRANLVYSPEQVGASVARWRRWAEARQTLIRLGEWSEPLARRPDTAPVGRAEAQLEEAAEAAIAAFTAAMDDDLNTSLALSVVDELAHSANEYAHGLTEDRVTAGTPQALRTARTALETITGAIGIELEDAEQTERLDEHQRAEVESLITERTQARTAKNWAEADRIRKLLDEQYGVVIKDTPQGTTWTRRG